MCRRAPVCWAHCLSTWGSVHRTKLHPSQHRHHRVQPTVTIYTHPHHQRSCATNRNDTREENRESWKQNDTNAFGNVEAEPADAVIRGHRLVHGRLGEVRVHHVHRTVVRISRALWPALLPTIAWVTWISRTLSAIISRTPVTIVNGEFVILPEFVYCKQSSS